MGQKLSCIGPLGSIFLASTSSEIILDCGFQGKEYGMDGFNYESHVRRTKVLILS